MKNLFLSILAVAAIACGFSSCNNAPKPTFAQGDVDSLAYAYGVAFGTQYSNFTEPGVVVPDTNVVMNLDNFLAGFITAMKKDTASLTMSAEDAQQFIQQFQMKLRQQMEEERQAKLNDEKAKGADFLAANAQKEGVQVLESGLHIQHLVEGTGAQAKEEDKVLVNYKGSLIDGTQFDANDSTEFNVNGVVKGFKEGIMNMKEGGKAILTMPSDLAYGDRGAGQNIPGGATLVFEVELLKVTPAKK